ncbi:MAG TPA: hypothetical protein VMU78_09845 [Methylocella sp.]|nr:hypothetical protein [Methylocella sp.]
MVGYDEASLKGRVQDYGHKAKVLRQIQSEKLRRSSFWNNVLNYSTVIISAFVTFLTFFGVKNLHMLFLSNFISLDRLDFLLSFFIFLLLIASFLQMTLNLGEKSLVHLAAIRELTDFLTTLDDLSVSHGIPPEVCERHIERLNDRYKTVNSILPANSDSEWRKAKKALIQKEK